LTFLYELELPFFFDQMLHYLSQLISAKITICLKSI
jgi:hypothetical protein